MFSGDIDKLVELLLDGYDHIIDIADEDNLPIVEAVSNAEQQETVAFLQSILAFEVCLITPFSTPNKRNLCFLGKT